MDDLYVECLVQKKAGAGASIAKGLAYGFTVVMALATLFVHPVCIVGIILGVLAIWLAVPMLFVEYEYLYVSRSLTVDKIFSKEKRKKAAEYDLEKMEIFAQEGAYQLDEFKNLKTVNRDYTSKTEGADRWIMIVHNGNDVERLILEPNEALIKAMKNQFPRKTFSK